MRAGSTTRHLSELLASGLIGVGQAPETDSIPAGLAIGGGVSGYNARYIADVLPQSDTPAWTRTVAGTPVAEAVSSGVLHLQTTTANSDTLTYSLADATSNYEYATASAQIKWVSGTGFTMEVQGMGRFLARISPTSSTSVLAEIFTGGSWFSIGTLTVSSTSDTFHTYRIEYESFNGGQTGGWVRAWFDQDVVGSSLNVSTAGTDNHVTFGDGSTTATSEVYVDEVSFSFRPTRPDEVPVGSTLTRIIHGYGATSLRVFHATPGHAYRVRDPAGRVVASSGTVGGDGIATFASWTPCVGLIEGFTDNTYATHNGIRWPQNGFDRLLQANVFDADPTQIGVKGIKVIETDGADQYATSQFGGAHNAIVETADYVFMAYRRGTTGVVSPDASSGLWIKRWNKALGRVDQGPVWLAGSGDGHMCFSLVRLSTGKLRFVSGGYAYGNIADRDISIRESTAVDDISGWTAGFPSNVLGSTAKIGGAWAYTVDPSDNGYLVGESDTANGGVADLWFAKMTAAAPTTPTWTKIAGHANGFTPILGNIERNPVSGAIGIAFAAINSGTLVAANAYYLESVDSFATARKADGTTAVTLPLTFDVSGNAAADLIASGHHYNPRMDYFGGKPFVLMGTDQSTANAGQDVVFWTGAAWSVTHLPGLYSEGGTCIGTDASAAYVSAGWVTTDPATGVRASFLRRYRTTDSTNWSYVDLIPGQNSSFVSPYAPFDELSNLPSFPNEQPVNWIAYPKIPSGGFGGRVMASMTDGWTSTVFLTDAILALQTGQATETDTANAASRVRLKVVTQALESDIVQAITHSRAYTIGQALETDAAQILRALRVRSVAQASELDLALAVTRVRLRSVGLASETDIAQHVTSSSILVRVTRGLAHVILDDSRSRPVFDDLRAQLLIEESRARALVDEP